MKQEHLSEIELQQLALEPFQTNHELAAHVHECAKCATDVSNYRAMFSALSTAEKPVFDFDIEKQVMAQLPVPTTRKTSFPWAVAAIIVISLAVSITVFNIDGFFASLFGSIPSPVIYLIVTTALTIVIFQCRELVASYRQKMRQLNFY
jgi:anti-sigma factor RsiW